MVSCRIQEITVQSKRPHNCTLYSVMSTLDNNQTHQIQRRDSEFVQFSLSIHQSFELTNEQLPEIKKKYSLFNTTLKQSRRESEIQAFCQQFLLLPTHVTSSELCISFFTTKPTTPTLPDAIKKVLFLLSRMKHRQQDLTQRCNAFSMSSTFISQEQKQQLKHKNLQRQCQSTSRINIQSMYTSHRHSATSATSTNNSSSVVFSSSSLDSINTIRLKVIYDLDNIIVIRVSRRVLLDELRSQVIQKFALNNVTLPEQLDLRMIDPALYSSKSGSSIICSVPADHDLEADMLISDDESLSKAMSFSWTHSPKAVVRCVL